MKIDWDVCSYRSFYLFLGTGILAMVWTYLGWPWAGIINIIPLFFVLGAFVGLYIVKVESQKKARLREEIRFLSNDVSLEGDFTIDDFDLLYEVDELEQIASILKQRPVGQRKLQSAIDLVKKGHT